MSTSVGRMTIKKFIFRRIDCGPKSSNVSRYRRDYYVHPSRMENHDVTFNENNNLLKKFKISDSNGPQGELVRPLFIQSSMRRGRTLICGQVFFNFVIMLAMDE